MSATPSVQAVTKAEFARQVQRDTKVIHRLIKRGLLPVDANGQIPLEDGLRAWAAIRPLAAPPPEEGGASASPGAPLPRPVMGPHPDAIAVDLDRKRAALRLQELKIARESGELVPRDSVTRDAETVGAMLRAGLTTLVDRVASQIEAALASSPTPEARARAVRALLERETDDLLGALHGSTGVAA